MNKTLVLDFETYYNSKEKYSLRNMTIEEYVNNPRFKAHGVSMLRINPEDYTPIGNPVWVDGGELVATFERIKLHEYGVVMHNAQFDAAVLSFVYGITPAFFFDTMSMSRGVFGGALSHSLENVADRLRAMYPDIITTAKYDGLSHTDGVRDLTPEHLATLVPYANNDTMITAQVFRSLMKYYQG